MASGLGAAITLHANVLGSSPLRYQWRRDGTNVPSATVPYLTLPAGDISTARITVEVENAFGSPESAPATVAVAAPPKLELSADLSFMYVWGTPGGVYRLEFSPNLTHPDGWSRFGDFEVPSSGEPARIKNLLASDYGPVAQRFYRALVRP